MSTRLQGAELQQRIEAWRWQGVSLRCTDQANELKAVRDAVPELAGHSDSAFGAFVRRVKAGEAPGFPRFRAMSRFHSADFRVGDGLVCRDGRLRLVGIPGLVKVRWHRALPAKSVHAIVSRSNGKWFVTLRFKVRDLRVPGEEDTRTSVGIDVGLNSIVATSDGVTVPAPRHLRKAQAKTRRLHRALDGNAGFRHRTEWGRGVAKERPDLVVAAAAHEPGSQLSTVSAFVATSWMSTVCRTASVVRSAGLSSLLNER